MSRPDADTDLVVDDLHAVVLDLARLDLVCNSAGIGKGGHGFADLVEGEDEVVGHGSTELLLWLVTEHNDGYIGVWASVALCECLLCRF